MRKTLWKKNGHGQKDSLSKFPARQKIRATLQEHFGQTISLPLAERNAKWKVRLADIEGYAGANTVNYWRCGIPIHVMQLLSEPYSMYVC
jgi:hypothetical protein